MLKSLPPRIFGSMFILICILVSEADAYIDPGSGSALLQLLLGGIAGIGVVAKLYWDRIKVTCRSLFGRGEKTTHNE